MEAFLVLFQEFSASGAILIAAPGAVAASYEDQTPEDFLGGSVLFLASSVSVSSSRDILSVPEFPSMI